MRAASGARSSLLPKALKALEGAGVEWCVLHGHEGYPGRVESDVDLIVHPADFVKVPAALMGIPGARVVQVRRHEATSETYTLASEGGAGWPEYLQLDVSRDVRGGGRILFRADAFIAGRRNVGGVWVPPPDLEFAFYLVKRLLKVSRLGEDALGPAQTERLTRLFRDDPEGCRAWLARLLPAEEAGLMARAAWSGRWAPALGRTDGLRSALLRTVGRGDRVGVARYWAGELRRWAGRALRPTGLAVAFLGADGAGKTTVLDLLEEGLSPAFSGTAQYRLRPGRRKGGGPREPVTDPHGLPPRGTLPSLAKLGIWCLDYTLGYAGRVYPSLARSTLVLFDRYYDDLLVDPLRYRYGGSAWAARAAGLLVHRPPVLVILDAPPETLRTRKREVSPRQTVRQRAAYLELARTLPNARVVDASGALDGVVAEVREIVLDHMAARAARRLGDRSL